MPRLTKNDVAEAIASGAPQKLADGNSLFLYVRGGSASWLYHFREGSAMRTRSLGTASELSLTAARHAREAFASERRAGRAGAPRSPARHSAAHAPSPVGSKRERFADVVESYLALKSGSWKAKSNEPRQYRHLKTGALGAMWADEIDQTHVENELKTRWGHVLASADKYRMRIMLCIDHAVAKQVRADSPNPARKAIIGNLIASAPQGAGHSAMARDEVPALMADLIKDGSRQARALAFLILTAARTSEARDVDWSEIDVKKGTWIIPASRMKEGKEHSVPLSKAALKLLGKPGEGSVFGAMKHDSLIIKLKSLRSNGYTVHGFRSTFAGWAANAKYTPELREMALAHAFGSKVFRDYNREDLIELRRPMMQSWSDFVCA